MKFHDVQMIDFAGGDMVLKVDGHIYRINMSSVSTRLAGADENSRRYYSISPSGYGVHWPHIDEDLTIDGLIASGRSIEPKLGEASESPLVLKEGPRQKPSPLSEHLHGVIEHVQKTRGQFSAVAVKGLKTMPIPFFGNIEEAEILTVGVNPAASEFRKNRNWPQTEATADYLESRLKSYFRLASPAPHTWFSGWDEALRLLDGRSYKNAAAHLDLSPRPTPSIPTGTVLKQVFLEMVQRDVAYFFKTIMLCRAAKVLLVAGAVTNRYYINEFLKIQAPQCGFELQGDFQRQRGGKIHCRHLLISKDGRVHIPVFFFSCGPRHPEVLRELVLKERKAICDCINNL